MNEAAGETRPRHVIIVGFGLSGRACANALLEQGVSICVIEMNSDVVSRCAAGGLQIIKGDASDTDVLRHAGIERASDVAVTIPQDEWAFRVVERVRQMNPSVRIIARCTFVSGGMEAHRRGADEVVVAEQVVAQEFGRMMQTIPHWP
jgi:voltage-gated potassium channel Kch